MEPLISLTINNRSRRLVPGETLYCEYQIDAVEAGDLQAVEASVLWYTEGKGDEDFSVHFFQRRTAREVSPEELRGLHRFSTELPASPLTYDGQIIKLKWCVRIRAFLKSGKEIAFDLPFQLCSAACAERDPGIVRLA